jgi:hypothetical protein
MSRSRFSSVFVALGALAWAGRARAYCREVTASPTNDYDPVTQGCFSATADGGRLFPLFWRNQCVSYSFQQQGSRSISSSDAARIAAQAFSTWSSAPCPGGVPSIVADPYPAVTCNDPQSQGHNNVIIFRDDVWPYDDAANSIGYTTLTVSTSTGEIFGADIEINSADYHIVADAADTSDAGKTYDLGSILTHEAGHFLGLAHSADESAVMFAYYKPGSTSLTADDVAGICSIYSPSGMRNTSAGPVAQETCNPSPTLGFSTVCGSLDSGTLVGSGPLPEADGGVPCADPPACSVGRAPGSARAGLGVCAMAILAGAFARRRVRRTRAMTIAATAALAVIAANAIDGRDASASVSTAALFEELVQEASAVAVVVPTERRALWEGNRIATYTRVHIDRLVAGQMAGELWVRTLGGAVGETAQIVEGQAAFALGRPSLVFLRPYLDPVTHAPAGTFVVVERAQGQFPIAQDQGQSPRLALASNIGALLPPPSEHWARASMHLLPGRTPRFARDVLRDRSLEDAAREIVAAWPLVHPI